MRRAAKRDDNHAKVVGRGVPVRKECVLCGGNYVIAKKLDRRGRRFCSKSCAAKYLGSKKVGNIVDCKICSTSFRAVPAKKAKYCSKKCLGVALSAERKGGEIVGRWAGKKDANHSELVSVFRSLGASVIDLSNIGNGCPDIAIWCHGTWEMVEIKNRNTAYGRKGLNKMQKTFADATGARVHVVATQDECIELVKRIRSGLYSPSGISVIQTKDKNGQLSAPSLCIPPKDEALAAMGIK